MLTNGEERERGEEEREEERRGGERGGEGREQQMVPNPNPNGTGFDASETHQT